MEAPGPCDPDSTPVQVPGASRRSTAGTPRERQEDYKSLHARISQFLNRLLVTLGGRRYRRRGLGKPGRSILRPHGHLRRETEAAASIPNKPGLLYFQRGQPAVVRLKLSGAGSLISSP